MNHKFTTALLTISALTVNVVSASNVVVGPVEPTAVAPVVSGYNSLAAGANTVVNGTNVIVLGRDNVVTGNDNTVVGGGNGTITANQSTLIGYNGQMDGSQEQTIVGSNSKTAGQGATVIGTHSEATAIDAVAVGNNAIADKSNAVAIGTNSVTDDAVGVDGITINGTRHVFAGEQPAAVVSFGATDRAGAGGVTEYNRQLQNVSAGRVNSTSLDAINGSQLFAVVDELNTTGAKLNAVEQKVNTNATAITNLGGLIDDHTRQINKNTSAISANANSILNLQGDVNANTTSVNELKNTATNHEGRIVALEQRTFNIAGDINNKINGVEKRMNKLGASSAALAGLHPLDFNKDDKASYAVSYGHYRNANAVALGAFYRPNERVMFGAGVSLGGETQVTFNVAFKTGKGSEYLAQSKNDRGEITRLNAIVEQLINEVNALKEAK